jgi:hypothetical protein
VGDREVRGQATIGGNLCAPAAATFSRGDLQAPLLALDARIRSAGSTGERTDSIEDFLAAGPDGRLVLEIEVDEPKRAASASVRRPHAHAYTILAVAAAETAAGIRVAIAGAGPRAVRAASVEQALAGGASFEDAGQKALDDVDPQDDALASASYRRRCCRARRPGARSSRRERSSMQTDRQRDRARALDAAAGHAAERAAGRARDHEPEGRLPARRLRCMHGPGRRRAAKVVPDTAGRG